MFVLQVYNFINKSPAINVVDYLFLSRKCFNRGRLIWNSKASPKFDFLHANTKYTGQHHSCDVKSTCNWHNFEFQMHGFPHIVSKGEMFITSHNPL